MLLLVLIVFPLLLLLFLSYLFFFCSGAGFPRVARLLGVLLTLPQNTSHCSGLFVPSFFLSILPFLQHAFLKIPHESLMVSSVVCGLFLEEATSTVCLAQDRLFSQETTLQPLPLLPNLSYRTCSYLWVRVSEFYTVS